jgi:hypothetical protein
MGCGSSDPTTRFKSFVAGASKSMEADQELNKKFKLSAPTFDVKATDSTVSPFVAQVVIDAIDLEQAAKSVPSDPDPQQQERLNYLHDFGDRTFIFEYAFQDGQWVVQKTTTESESTGIDAINAKDAGPPSELVRYFTPQ